MENEIMTDGHVDRFRAGLVAAAVGALAIGALGPAACGGATQVPANQPTGAHPEVLVHEPCQGARMQALDTDPKGKPEVRRLLDSSGRELCRIVDLDHDGKPDLYEYFDPATGEVRRREYCYDKTGVVNAIELYRAGKLAERQYDLAGRQRVDTWDWFDPAVPVDPKTGRPLHPTRRERDSNGDGQVDQWWTWNDGKLTIASDHTGDGKPDPDTAIVVGGGEQEAPSGPPPYASGTDGGGGGSGSGAASQEGGEQTGSSAASSAATTGDSPQEARATDGGAP